MIVFTHTMALSSSGALMTYSRSVPSAFFELTVKTSVSSMLGTAPSLLIKIGPNQSQNSHKTGAKQVKINLNSHHVLKFTAPLTLPPSFSM